MPRHYPTRWSSSGHLYQEACSFWLGWVLSNLSLSSAKLPCCQGRKEANLLDSTIEEVCELFRKKRLLCPREILPQFQPQEMQAFTLNPEPHPTSLEGLATTLPRMTKNKGVTEKTRPASSRSQGPRHGGPGDAGRASTQKGLALPAADGRHLEERPR